MSQYASASSRIDIDQLKKDIIETHKNFKIKHHISLLGGEIFLEPRWSEVLTLIEDLYLDTIQVRFYSNGLLLNKNKESIVKHINRGSIFRISLHESPETKIGKKVMSEIRNFLQYVKTFIPDAPSMDDVFLKDDDLWNPHRIAVSPNYDVFWTELFKTKNNKLYPHQSNDVVESYKHCPCYNAQLYNGRLWKCPQTAYLRDTLKAFGQLEDEVWQPYLKYKGVSLNPSKSDKDKFYRDQTVAADFCSMCPKGGFYSKKSQDIGKKRHIKVVPL